MKSNLLRVVLLSIVFLFFFQLAGTLIESVYILDLLNTSLDEKALGLLFFFTPMLLFVFRGKYPRWLLFVTVIVTAISRGVTPYLSTPERLFSAGIGVGAVLWLLVLLQRSVRKNTLEISAGLALATALSALLRTVGAGLDYSLTVPGGWLGGLLAVGLIASCWFLQHSNQKTNDEELRSHFSNAFGLMLVVTLVLFAFSAPSVISRWVEGDYVLIVVLVSGLALAYTAVAFLRPAWIETLVQNKAILLGGNLVFTLAMLSMFLVHRVAFPVSPDASAVIITPPTFLQQIPLLLTLLTFPILFVDAAVFMRSSNEKKDTSFIFGILVGTLVMVVTLFMLVFTNIWGYVEPVSLYFRNQFYLPFLLLTGGITMMVLLQKVNAEESIPSEKTVVPAYFMAAIAACFVITVGFALWTARTLPVPAEKSSLTVMTYNIQQANDEDGRKSYLRQLEIIREIDPDIIALQESDSARIGLNNNDYVRYYASQLGYYSYFGPATSTGTYGTAILSLYPLENPHVIFSYSDQDEIGTTAFEIVVDGRHFSVFNVHPDGSDAAMLTFAETLLEQSADAAYVIALGDFNLRHTEEAYQRIAAVYHNVPDSEGHIDHIFLSHNLQMVDPVYVPAPQSATDHPLLYAVVTWE